MQRNPGRGEPAVNGLTNGVYEKPHCGTAHVSCSRQRPWPPRRGPAGDQTQQSRRKLPAALLLSGERRDEHPAGISSWEVAPTALLVSVAGRSRVPWRGSLERGARLTWAAYQLSPGGTVRRLTNPMYRTPQCEAGHSPLPGTLGPVGPYGLQDGRSAA